MRSTHIFVLRLLIDSDEPSQLRGALHSVADDASYPFADAQALLALLQQITRSATARAGSSPRDDTDFKPKGDSDEQDN